MKNPFLFIILSLFSISLYAQTTISSPVSFTQSDVNNNLWPIIITNGATVTLAENITLNQTDQYFIIGSDNVVFDGNNFIVTIDNVTDYPGLLQNGSDAVGGYSNVAVNNTRVHSNNATLFDEGGWIGQTHFAHNASSAIISNCYSDGVIGSFGGGITGSYSSCTVIKSHSSGEISFAAGGIFGAFSDGTAINCFSIGDGGDYSGGIFGYNSNGSASDCYSTGSIGNSGGGIFAYYSSGSVSQCYSTGIITSFGGGITGADFSGSIVNCYSTGNIDSYAAGIAGRNNTGSITNSYSIGVIDPSGGDITGTNNTGTIINSLAEGDGVWNDLSAIDILTGVDGTIWTDVDRSIYNVPFKLTSFNAILYSPVTENIAANAMIQSPQGNFYTGSYSIVNINDNYPSSYPSVTINYSSGMISFTNSGAGSYAGKILYTDSSDGSYQISNYTLNVMTTLPVTWSSFTVTPRGSAAWLQWSTAIEQNTRDFKIQHSINGSNWTTINTVTAAGNSATISNYSYLHADPVPGNNYYRIQQTDLDGRYSYSTIQNMKIILTGKSFSILNTIVDNAVLQVAVKAPALLRLYGNDGKLYWQKQFTTGAQNIDLGNIPKGVYFLKGKDAVEKILVQ